MTDTLQQILDRISRGLFVESLNYEVNFMVKMCKGRARQSLEEVLSWAFRQTVQVSKIQKVKDEDVLKALYDALSYDGGEWVHPGRTYLNSSEFRTDKENAISQLKTILAKAKSITAFQLEEGHPFYPVFWEFAFLIEHDLDAILFIGSSSD
jgi:hypothetical protein